MHSGGTIANITFTYLLFRIFWALAEKFIRELLLKKVAACAIGFVNRNISQCLQNFCPFQQSQRITMLGNN